MLGDIKRPGKQLRSENEIIIMITGSVRRKDDEPDGHEKWAAYMDGYRSKPFKMNGYNALLGIPIIIISALYEVKITP